MMSETSSEETSRQDLETKYNLEAEKPKGAYSDEKIMSYEKRMGFPVAEDDFVIVQQGSPIKRTVAGNFFGGPIVGGLASLTAKWFIMCFKDDGILLLGLNLMSGFSGKNLFIPKESIKQVTAKKALSVFGVMKIELVTDNDKKLKFQNRWQASNKNLKLISENHKHLPDLAAKYDD